MNIGSNLKGLSQVILKVVYTYHPIKKLRPVLTGLNITRGNID